MISFAPPNATTVPGSYIASASNLTAKSAYLDDDEVPWKFTACMLLNCNADVPMSIVAFAPGLTPAKMKEVVLANCSTTIYNPTEHISGSQSLQGGNVKLLFNKYGQSNPFTYTGSFTTTTDIGF